MFQVKWLDANKNEAFMEFATHAEASRFVRGCLRSHIKAVLVTKQEVTPQGKFGGYHAIDRARPVHCL